MYRFGNFFLCLMALLVMLSVVSVPVHGAQAAGRQKAGPAPRTPDGHPDFNGVWFPGVVPDPDHYGLSAADHRTFDPKVTPQEPPSFQPWAIEKRKLMGDFERVGPGVECRPRGATGFGLGAAYPIGVVQTPERFVLLSEQETTWRIIYTDGRSHEKDLDPSFNGDSIGHWEGDTLVVDVTALDTQMWLSGAPGWFPSDAVHIMERFRRPDANTLIYQATIEDPKVLTKPWTSVPRTFTYAPGKRLYEGYCIHNYDYDALNPGAKIPQTAEGNDERFFDQQEYERLRRQYNK